MPVKPGQLAVRRACACMYVRVAARGVVPAGEERRSLQYFGGVKREILRVKSWL
jgi:hypothetical protein